VSLRPLRTALSSWAPKGGSISEPLHALAAAWPAIVGADVAANCAPVALSGDALVVATRSSAWSQQLQLLSPAILDALASQGLAPRVRRVTFRSGSFRKREPRPPAPPAAQTRMGHHVTALEPAVDLDEAFERVRHRIRSARRSAPALCAECGAPLDVMPTLAAQGRGQACAACNAGAFRRRMVTLERLLYAAPWLTLAEVREQVPQTSPAAYERARTRLLQRWWLVLERLRKAKRPATRDERSIASSYVLLQSRFGPERVTPAIVRHLLGEELAEALSTPHVEDDTQ